MTDNPIYAALMWLFTQAINDPEIIIKIVRVVLIVLVIRAFLWLLNVIQRAFRKKWREQYSRSFSTEQRERGFARAGYQCEFDNGFSRCRARAEHADHFYPWSRGGATSMRNLVASCAPHNLAKSAKMPSAMTKMRIETRRKSYFPAFTDLTAGEWSSKTTGAPVAAKPTVEFR